VQIAKVAGLMAGLTILLVAVGSWLGGSQGAIIMFAVSLVMNLGTYWFSDRMVLRMYKARVIERADAPELHGMVERLAARAGVPMPTVAIAPQPQPNAFATGRNPEHGVVCFTQGILQALSPEELEGVTAHELAHIKHRHILVGTVAASMAGAIATLAAIARWGFIFGSNRDNQNPVALLVGIIVAPIAATIIRLAISRQNEFQADATAAEIAGGPDGLVSALGRMEVLGRRTPMRVNPAAAQLAIVNPLSGDSLRGLGRLMSTHPPTEERVARLRALGKGGA
jgi:heat shock protein HtpX